MKKKIFKILKLSCIILLCLLVIGMILPTWTPKIEGENSISELRQVEVNGTELEVMIRGNDRSNPVIIFAHGGPCCSEIPYVRKYQDLLEKDFTVVHYDQRGSGKSYHFFEDYSDLTASTHVEDLIELTKYIKDYLDKEKIVLIGHSFGTYIGTMAVAEEPEMYDAYIGIGQMGDTVESELDGLYQCIEAAEREGNIKDVTYLKELEDEIKNGNMKTPRKYVRKYGFAARLINEDLDYLQGFWLGSEYNLLDAIRFYVGLLKNQEKLLMESLQNPVTERVKEISIPVYFVMGQYDYMTSLQAAEDYLYTLGGHHTRELVIFEESAHYPQFEEEAKFYQWMCNTFQ